MPALGLAANGFGPNPFTFAWPITHTGFVDPVFIRVRLVAVLRLIVRHGGSGRKFGLGYLAFWFQVAVHFMYRVKQGAKTCQSHQSNGHALKVFVAGFLRHRQ